MKVRRLAASISACFDDFVAKVENHDAVAKVAIEDVQKAAAKIRTEKNRVDLRLKALIAQQDEHEQSIERWRSRAKSCVEKDEEKAMQCLQQAKRCEKQSENTLAQMQELQRLQHSLSQNLQAVENKLDELSSKRALLASRETRAEVHRKTSQQVGSLNVDDVFSRWELNVMEKEYQDQSQVFACEGDIEERNLEKSFADQEERELLLAELNTLKSVGDGKEG